MAITGTDPQHSNPADGLLQANVRRYYRTLAPFLDADLEDRGDEELWLTVGLEHRDGAILELGCGSGRVTRLLAEHGAHVVGVDLCPELLTIARRRLVGKSVQLLLADMRQLAFRCRFDVIVAPNDPFSHLVSTGDRARALATVAAHLAPAGCFLLDALWFAPNEDRRITGPGGLLLERELTLDGCLVQVTERWRCDPGTQCCTTEYGYHRAGAAKPARAAFRSRYWTRAGVTTAMAAAGLQVDEVWGDYERGQWDARSSSRLVVSASLAQ